MKKSENDYLLLFTLPSCPQCNGLKMSLKKVGLEYEESDEYDKYNIMSVPTLILMKVKRDRKHEEEKRCTGYRTPDELNEFVKGSSCTRWIKKEGVIQNEST